MSAVASKETTDMIRRYGVTEVTAPELFFPYHSAPVQRDVVQCGKLSEAVKREAMSAVGSKETAAQIRLMRDCGQVFPPSTPSRESQRIAEMISRMHETGHGQNAIHRAASKDNFGREDYGA